MLFVSDVRTSEDAESQNTIEVDIKMQEKWHQILKPKSSLFKFRLPWTEGKMKYLEDYVKIPFAVGVGMKRNYKYSICQKLFLFK